MRPFSPKFLPLTQSKQKLPSSLLSRTNAGFQENMNEQQMKNVSMLQFSTKSRGSGHLGPQPSPETPNYQNLSKNKIKDN